MKQHLFSFHERVAQTFALICLSILAAIAFGALISMMIFVPGFGVFFGGCLLLFAAIYGLSFLITWWRG